jgi:hypothetical protein
MCEECAEGYENEGVPVSRDGIVAAEELCTKLLRELRGIEWLTRYSLTACRDA